METTFNINHKVKRYALFSGLTYYPAGGFNDFVAASDDVDELKSMRTDDADWAHIVDLGSMRVIYKPERRDKDKFICWRAV